MKSNLKKVSGVALAAVLALGMFSCSNGSSDDSVMPPVSGKQTVATPAFSVASGEVDSGTSVTITCSTEGSKIYYTTDGTEPTASGTEYTAAISVTPPMILKAIAVKSGMNGSAVASASYTIKGTIATPAFSVASGEVDSGTNVTITCATEGAKIYYTTDETDPTAESTEYKAAISVTPPMTLKAIAVKDGMNDSAVASASYTIKGTIATPAFSVASGAVNSGTEVTISCATEGAKIYYTTDGSDPTAESTEYKAAISVTTAVTVKAIAVKSGMNDSAVASASYTIKGTVATPAFSVASGAVNSGTSVTISCSTEGAKIYYTTDGSDPTASGTEYKAAISVTPPMTLKAIAVKDGMNDSAVASASYTIKGTVTTPEFSVASGAVNSGTSVTITCSTEGAKIYYTTDGSDPTASGTEYTAAISVTPPMILKAIAVKSGMNDSAVASASYTIKGTVATPTFSVASGAVNSGTSVTITCSTEGAKIYYTTDGSDPTASGTEYKAAISVTPPMTLKAIAVKSGMNGSAVASASYTIKGTVATPAFSVASGAVNSGTSVTISCATEGAKIYYTTDGTDPTASGTEYKAAISVTPPMTLKAIAVKSGMNGSAVASASYTIKGTVATPAFSVSSGAVNSGTSVTITCSTEGAKIYYTTDGSDPTASGTEYKAAISVTPPMTLKAIAVKSGMNGSAVASASYTIKGTVATPAFSVSSGAVNSGTSVTITCSTEGAKIYYTTDGSDPTASGTEYKAAISVTPPMTLKAIAVKSGMNGSAVASASYTIKGTVATPAFSVASGAVNSGTSVTISCSTEGAKIYYTTDGTEPTASGTEYTAAISVTPPMILKAIAVKSGMNGSAVASASYTIKGTVATPTFSVASGAVNSGTSVTITCSTEGAKIYYTTDGTDPTAESTEYKAAISVTPPMTLKAIAVKSGMNGSAVASASYTIKGTVATPAFSVASGAVNSGTSVTITCSTEGAKIYYTTDGTDPTAESTEYKAAISVTPPMTLKAIAVKSGMNDSAVASASYTIKGTVATPAFSVASGAVNSGTSVTISCSTEGAKIYYTTDGTEPTASSTEYKAEISVTPPMKLKAIAVKSGMNNSAVASVSYTIKGTVATPAFSVASGAVNSGTSVTITCGTEGAKIYFTTDGTKPTASNTEYKAAISITEAVTVKAIAVKDGMNNSAVASASYLIIPTKDTCVPGDFVLKDGTMLPKDITLTDTQKSNVAAVIVRAAADGKPALGIGVRVCSLAWCTSSAKGYSTIITALDGSNTTGYMDGSDGWDKLKAACYDARSNPENYPAWNYSLTYAKTNGLTGALATGWYLPTVAELYTIYYNKTAVNASFSKAAGRPFAKLRYWSCSCNSSLNNRCALALDLEYGAPYIDDKTNDFNVACSVRAFN